MLEATPDVKVIAVASDETETLSYLNSSAPIERALEAGISGYVFQTDIGEDLLDAIRSLYRGKRFLVVPLPKEFVQT